MLVQHPTTYYGDLVAQVIGVCSCMGCACADTGVHQHPYVQRQVSTSAQQHMVFLFMHIVTKSLLLFVCFLTYHYVRMSPDEGMWTPVSADHHDFPPYGENPLFL